VRRAALALLLAAVVTACGGHQTTKAYPVGAQSRSQALPQLLPPSSGRVFYVAPGGSDGASGTAHAPWRTVQKALDTLAPGQTVVIRRGVYAQNLTMARSGTPEKPITLHGEPGAVLAAGTGESQNVPLTFQGASYVRVAGVEIRGATGSSTADVYATEGAHDVELSRCDVHGSTRQGLFADRTTSRVTVAGCFVHDNGGAGPSHLDHNIYLEGRDQTVVRSVISGARNGAGVQIYPDSDGVLVAHNTIVRNSLDGVIVGGDGGTTSDRARIFNNIVALNGRYGISTYWSGPVGSDDVARRNLAWKNGAGQFVGGGMQYSENRVADPRFVNPAMGDWRTRAANAGA
jgi:hypothetical protein